MPLVNSVEMSGYVATDPKIVGKDMNVGKFRIRFDKSKNTGSRETPNWETESSFFSVTVFGNAKAQVNPIDRFTELAKGDKVLVVGRLQQKELEKDGNKREFIDIVATEFALIEKDTRNGKNKSTDDDDDWLKS